jgi:large subunit ribosomal protein L17
MRHKKSLNHLGRTASHRKSMLANMAASLILHKRIKTTTVKAKALRTYVEPLITKSKEDSTHSRRMVFSYLQDKEAVSELFREVSPKIIDRPGGYTRILKVGSRLGDNADMCIMELVDFNENMIAAKEEADGKSTRRRRRSTKKKTDEQPESLNTDVKGTDEVVVEKSKEVKTEAKAKKTAEKNPDSKEKEEE